MYVYRHNCQACLGENPIDCLSTVYFFLIIKRLCDSARSRYQNPAFKSADTQLYIAGLLRFIKRLSECILHKSAIPIYRKLTVFFNVLLEKVTKGWYE